MWMVICLRNHTIIKDDPLSLHTYSKVSHVKYSALINLELYCYSSAVSVCVWHLTGPAIELFQLQLLPNLQASLLSFLNLHSKTSFT